MEPSSAPRMRLLSDTGSCSARIPSASASFVSYVSDDSSLFSVDTKNYAAIYEFSQGSFPKIVYEHGALQFENKENFLLSIVNTPLNCCSSDYSTLPSVIVSSFEGVSFLAVYTQIFDEEARGFTRPIVFVIANQTEEIITKMHSQYLEQIIGWVSKLQQPSIDHFKEGLTNFAASLYKIQKQLDDKNTAVNSKVQQLDAILPLFGIKELDVDNAVDRSVEYFTIINNDLVDIKKIMNLDFYLHDLDSFIDSLPTTRYLMNIVTQSNYMDSPYSVDFGGSSSFRGFGGFSFFAMSVMKPEPESCSYSLKNFIKNQIFYYIGFTLLSGQTLIIRTNEVVVGSSIAQKLVVLCPFFRPSHQIVTDSITPTESLKYSIVVTKKIDGDAKNIASVLDLNDDFYIGDGCPPSSIVCQVLGKCVTNNDIAFVMHVFQKLKNAAYEFVFKLSEFSSAKEKNPDNDLFTSFASIGFSKDDAPILKYWIHSYFNNDNLKPILYNNKSKAGLTMAPF